jgi:signal peptidase II
LWGDLVRLQHTQNHGAFLSLGATFSESTRFCVFIVAAGFALAGMVTYLIRKPDISAYDIVAVSLIVGGGVGNLIDRLLFSGGVTDFLNLGIGQLRTGIFNIADVEIMIGGIMILYRSFRPARSGR